MKCHKKPKNYETSGKDVIADELLEAGVQLLEETMLQISFGMKNNNQKNETSESYALPFAQKR